MRRIAAALWVVLLLLAPGPAAAQRAAEPQSLAAFARQIGLREIPAFAEAVNSLRATGHLPSHYVTKSEARANGWHGGGLCAVMPGHAIGRDAFRNLGRRLPAAPGRSYREADLDATCDSRGPKRLIFSNDGLIFVTLDHYDTFVQVP